MWVKIKLLKTTSPYTALIAKLFNLPAAGVGEEFKLLKTAPTHTEVIINNLNLISALAAHLSKY